MSLFWPLGRPWKREKKRGIYEEVGGSVWRKMEFWNCWNFGKLEFLWIVEEGKKENRKRKRKWKREIILLEEKVKIIRVADSRDSVADAEIFRENTGIVRNSSISERPEIIIKNQEYYFKTHGEIRLEK